MNRKPFNEIRKKMNPERLAKADRKAEYIIWEMSLVKDPKIMAGETVFPDTRITVKQIAQLANSGEPTEIILQDYNITEQDIEFASIWWEKQNA